MKTEQPQETFQTIGEAAARLLAKMAQRAQKASGRLGEPEQIQHPGRGRVGPGEAEDGEALEERSLRPSSATAALGGGGGLRLIAANDDNAGRVEGHFPAVARDARMRRPAPSAGSDTDGFTVRVRDNVRWDLE